MSSHPVRSYRRRKMNLELDLNRDPPPENVREDVEGSSQRPQLPTIDVDAIDVDAIDVDASDDDVVESSPRAFAQAKRNARRTRRRIIVDVDADDQTRRDPPNLTIINLESSSSSMSENSRKSPEPPQELVFNCPICMAPLVEEMSTRCGHIFCKNCIKSAITAQGRCPTCRKRITARELIRVFLPTAT